MTLIPAAPQPLRPRTDAASGLVERSDRRSDDGMTRSARDAFASSLASARADRAAQLPNRATRDVMRDDRVRDLMLSGAMKYAAAKCDGCGTSTTLKAPAATPSASVENGATPAPAPGEVVLSPVAGADVIVATPAPDAPAVELAAATPDAGLVALPTELVLAVPTDVVVRALPEMVNLPVDGGEPDEAATPSGVPLDLSTTDAATMAAMQLIATLPIAVPTLVPASTPDASASEGSGTGQAAGMQAGAEAAQAIANDSTLVEDHFDVPANTAAGITDAAIAPVGVTRPQTALPEMAATSATEPGTTETSTTEMAAAAMAAKSAASAAAAGRADISALQSDLARLDPEFRDRLERVIDRMHREFGHDVTVVETVRSQARQEALFAQGRTAPGPIVTWTKNSKHAKGLAADLMVDGQWDNPKGYAHLAEVANAEGLRTLGARDPGHVEMTGESAVSGETLGTLLNDLRGDAGDAARQLRADVSGNGGAAQRSAMLARVADVAQVARVATVASVAKVATVARPGAAAASDAASNFSPLAVSGAAPMMNGADAAAAMRVVTPTPAVNMADRISHLMDLQATQDAKPLNSVLLRMDNANGIEDQIRIDTRGTLVDARLGLGNAQQAAALTDRIGELREALERRGLTADGVRVQASAASRAVDSATFSRPSLQTIELAAMRAASDSQANGGTRDQASRDQQQREALARDTARHTPRSSADDPRHRSRREQPEDRR